MPQIKNKSSYIYIQATCAVGKGDLLHIHIHLYTKNGLCMRIKNLSRYSTIMFHKLSLYSTVNAINVIITIEHKNSIVLSRY